MQKKSCIFPRALQTPVKADAPGAAKDGWAEWRVRVSSHKEPTLPSRVAAASVHPAATHECPGSPPAWRSRGADSGRSNG